MDEALFARRHEDYKKALKHEEGCYVPLQANIGSGMAAYGGMKTIDALRSGDYEGFAKAVTKLFDELYADTYTLPLPIAIYQAMDFWGHAQMFIAPDGISLQHIPDLIMKEDEYPLLINDLEGYTKYTLLPRKYPQIFTDPLPVVSKQLKAVNDEFGNIFFVLAQAIHEAFQQGHSMIPAVTDNYSITNPFDELFDSYRGFKGTMTDLRRQKENVKAACEMFWNTRIDHMESVEEVYPPVQQAPHIPCYLSPKQFDEFYWPYEKQQLENVAKCGGQTHILLEGSWKNHWEHFRDLPKDSMILQVDDDDIFEVYEALGDHQIICGGLPVSVHKYKGKEECIDYVRKVFDTMAPGGGFIFACNKSWEIPGDMNQNIIDCFNFAHEYGKY